jgi:NTP pyrophosphatase (non-canonical NTP hydrolase)
MISLKEHAKEAQKIAFNRWRKTNVEYSTIAILKHCAGEVCEAVEAYKEYLYEPSKIRHTKLADELADIITCVLIAAANEGINIEKALQACQQKNEKRTAEAKKND